MSREADPRPWYLCCPLAQAAPLLATAGPSSPSSSARQWLGCHAVGKGGGGMREQRGGGGCEAAGREQTTWDRMQGVCACMQAYSCVCVCVCACVHVFTPIHMCVGGGEGGGRVFRVLGY